MGIYLGNTELGGGGGGGTPIGGLSYLIPQTGTTFTDGQEVYTNPDDSTVWIRSGAQLNGDGAGALDAALYRDSAESFSAFSGTQFQGSARSNRFGSNFDGRNVVVCGYNGTNGRFTLFQPDGTQIVQINTTDLSFSASVFYNSTHTFIMDRWIDSVGTVSLGTPNIRYVQTSTLTGSAGYDVAGDSNWTAPTGFTSIPMACVTNAGTSEERHWFTTNHSGTSDDTITEHTFNPTAANGTSAWTSTGNSLTFSGSQVGKIQGDGNSLFVHIGTNMHEYNATTRTLIKTLLAPQEYSGNVLESGVVLIPAASSASGAREFWFTPPATTTYATPHTRYQPTEVLTAPFKGTLAAREAITLKDVDSGTTFSADNILNGTKSEITYLWQRIA